MAATELKQAGWHITDAAFGIHSEDGKRSVQQTISALLNVDLREIGDKSLPEGINKGKIDTISGPMVMQVQKIRNVSAPKENEESQAAPRMLKLNLTDGQTSCCAVEQELIDKLTLNTPPGSKIKLKGHITMKHGFLLLNKTNTKYLGGHVPKLVEPWELKRSLAKHTRSAMTAVGGPPQFVPFDQRNRRDRTDYVNDKLANNFKSLEVIKKSEPEEKKENDDDFAQQRKATIQEALRRADSKKTFGSGGKPKVQDPEVVKLVDMGFSSDEAVAALKQSGNNVSDAVAILTGAPPAPSSGRQMNDRVQRGRGGRMDRGRGRGRNRDDDDDDISGVPSRPSGPATLFDFLETKIKPGTDSKYDKKAVASVTRESQAPRESQTSRSNHSSGRSSSPNSDKKSSQHLPPRLQRLDQSQKAPESRYDGVRRHKERSGDSHEYSSETSSKDSRDSSRDLDRGYRNKRNDRTESARTSSYNNRQGNEPGSYLERRYGNQQDNDRGHGDERGQRNVRGQWNDRGHGNERGQDDERGQGHERGQNRRYGNRQGTFNDRSSSAVSRSNNTNSGPRSQPSTENNTTAKARDTENKSTSKPRDEPRDEPRDHGANSRGGDEKRGAPKRSNVSVHQAMNSGPQNGGHPRNYKARVDSVDYYANGREEDYPGQEVYDYSYMEPVLTPSMIQTPVQDWQAQQAHYTELKGGPHMWRAGDLCVAKYYPDGQFYDAVISRDPDQQSVCHVTFTQYGNTEQCHITDIRPLKFHPTPELQGAMFQFPVYQYAPPTAYIPALEPYNGPITTLEFTHQSQH